jgi:ribose 5-phosphate isomerase B
MKLAIGCDHGGYNLKEKLKKYLQEKNIEVVDCGTNSTERVDYPDYAEKVGKIVAAGEVDRGILVCGTGIGMSIAANKVKGIRAAVCGDCYSAQKAREHNDANILCLGERVVGFGLAEQILDTYLNNEFLGSYHTARVEKIMNIEKEK